MFCSYKSLWWRLINLKIMQENPIYLKYNVLRKYLSVNVTDCRWVRIRVALAITRFRDSNAIRLISFFSLSFSPLALVIGSPSCPFSHTCFPVLYVFRLVVPEVQAHLIAPGLHPHIKLFSSTPARRLPGAWLARHGPHSHGSHHRARW